MDRSYDRERFGRRYEEERWGREPERRFDYERGRGEREGYGEYWRGGAYGRGSDYAPGREYGYGAGTRGREDRGFIDRASDEVRSWFGDEDAERRRSMDEREYGERRWSPGEPAWRQREEQTWREQGHYGGYEVPSYRPGVPSSRLGWTDWTESTPRGRHTAGDWTHGQGSGEGPSEVRQSRAGFSGDYPGPSERYGSMTERYGSITGQYFGRGPKGYQRSDERIKEDVCECLTQHGEIDASDMEVTVNSGEVTLLGSVSSRWAKRMAEEAIENVAGVKDVHNQLRVSEQGAFGQQPSEGPSWRPTR
jgi:osmotically-inducible protein OsmY